MISSVDLAHDGVSRAKDWLSVKCGIGRLRKSGGQKNRFIFIITEQIFLKIYLLHIRTNARKFRIF